jgi:hypothetical protein
LRFGVWKRVYVVANDEESQYLAWVRVT